MTSGALLGRLCTTLMYCCPFEDKASTYEAIGALARSDFISRPRAEEPAQKKPRLQCRDFSSVGVQPQETRLHW